MMQYIKFNIVFFLFFSAISVAQEIESGLSRNSKEDLNITVENLVNQAKNEKELFSELT